MTPTAILADDEPLLLQALERALAAKWPQLQILAKCSDGEDALRQALLLKPSVCFFDVRMPRMSGIESATALADEWGAGDGAFPLMVFVTAYDQYALAAFEAQAADYLLKPLEPQRLAQSVARLQARLGERDRSVALPTEANLLQIAQALGQLQTKAAGHLTSTVESTTPLRFLQASQGNTLHVVPVDEVIAIEAADRYLRIFTANAEHLIRTPLRELQAQLPANEFWQIHRSVLVRTTAIAKVLRDDAGKLTLTLKQRPEVWPVSRMFAAQFRAM